MFRLLKTKTGRVLLENFISLSLLQIIGYVLPFITFPYIARTVGVEYYGEVAFASSVIVFFQVITDFGFNYTAVKDIARCIESKDEVSSILSIVLMAKVLLMILSFLVLLALIYFIPSFGSNSKILLLTFSLIPGYIMFPEWFFQGIQKMKFTALFSSLIKIVFTILIFLVIKEKSDYIFIPLLNSMGYLLIGIVSIIFIVRKLGYSLKMVSFFSIWNYIKKSNNMFLTLFFPNFYSNISVVFVESFWGKSAVGIFDIGRKFLGLSSQVASVLSRVSFPYFAKKMDNFKKYEILNLVVSIVMSMSLFFGAPFIIRLFFSEEFYDAAIVLQILSIASFFIFIVFTYGNNYLVLKDKEYLLRNIIVGCSILGFVLSYFFVKRYSYIGASITISLIWALRGTLVFLFSKKHK